MKVKPHNDSLLRVCGGVGEMCVVAKAKLVSTQIPKAISDELDGFCARTARNKRAMIARVLQFWMRFEDPVRSAIIGGVDRGAELLYADILEGVAKELRMKHAAPNNRTVGDTHTIRTRAGVQRHGP